MYVSPTFVGTGGQQQLKEPVLKWLFKALETSVGKKFVMGITGLLLCGFLVVHLAGNLLMLVGADAYNDYAHKLHGQEGLLMVAETGLFLLFFVHIGLAFRTVRENRLARKQQYEQRASKIDGGDLNKLARSDTWMFVSGAIVLGFLILHLIDFKFELHPDIDYSNKEPFDKAMVVLKTPLSFSIYCVGCVALLFHLSHGFASAFQSLGINHPKYNPIIRTIALLFALAVGFGFIIFPLMAMFE